MFIIKRKPLFKSRKGLREKDVGLVELTGELINRLQKEGRDRTARAYGSAMRSLLCFLGEEDICMDQLSSSLIKRYENYLLIRGCRLNTVSFYMRNLRAMYNKGAHMGLIRTQREELFWGVYTGIQQTAKRSACENDIRRIQHWVEEKSKEKNTGEADPLLTSGYYFLFCFYARGMSYVDMAYLKKTDIHDEMICYRRRKTGQLLEVKLTPDLRRIIAFFSPYVKDSTYIFPIICKNGRRRRLQYENGLRMQNLHLKTLGKTIRSSVLLSTHVARHTWATIARKAHIPLAVISEGLGHSSEKTTSIYLASFESHILDRANRRVASWVKKTMLKC